MTSFRFERYQNSVVKHHMSAGIKWQQSAMWAFNNDLNGKATVVETRMIDADTVEILKRYDQKPGMMYRWFGTDQKGLYERVIINRNDQTTAVDRMDGNWWNNSPFLGRRDLFYMEKRENDTNERVTFVRHDFWIPKLSAMAAGMTSTFSAWSYGRAFANTK